MISTKLYSIALIALFGLIVFNSLEHAACEEDGVAKTEEVTKEEGAKTEEVKDEGHKCEGDNCKTCKEDANDKRLNDDLDRKFDDDKIKSGVTKTTATVTLGPKGEIVDKKTGKILSMTKEGMQAQTEEDEKRNEKEKNDKEEQTRKECINILKKFNFNGLMTHDVFEVDFKINEKGETLSDIKLSIEKSATITPSKEEIENDTSQNYKMHIDYLVTKVVSTETDLLDYYCNKIDPILRLGFRGDYDQDMDLEEYMIQTEKKPQAALLEEDKRVYLDFIHNQKTYDFVLAKKTNGILKVNLTFYCALAKDWFTSHVPPTSSKCIEEYQKLNFKGFLTYDNNILAKMDMIEADLLMEKAQQKMKEAQQKTKEAKSEEEKTEPEEKKKELPHYGQFLKYLINKSEYAASKNVLILYCDIIDTLRESGFTGKKEDVTHEVADKKLNTDIINGYTHFINTPENIDGEEDLRFKFTLFRIRFNES